MKHPLQTVLCFGLALVLGLGLCGCNGRDSTATTNPTLNPAEFTPEQSYHIIKNKDNSFAVTVANHAGETLFHRDNVPNQPECTALDGEVLQVLGRQGPTVMDKWVVYCNVKTGAVSPLYSGFITRKENHVVYVDYLSNQYHIFVRDLFAETENPKHFTLPDLVPASGASPIDSYRFDQNGDLEVTYPTLEGTKTATIQMP